MQEKIIRKPGRPRDEDLVKRRQESILIAASKAFADRGFSGTDVEEIARSLDVGKGTIYRYFPSKRDLFLSAADFGMRMLSEEVASSADSTDDPLEQIERAIVSYLTFFDSNPEFLELIIQERANFKERKKPTYFEYKDTNVGRWQSLFRKLIKDGRARDVPVEKITDALSDIVYGTMFTNIFSGRKKSLNEQARDILDVIFNGILTAKPEESVEKAL